MPHREVVKTWYRSLKPDGSLWCESSNPQEVLEQSDSDCAFQKLEIIQVTGQWEPWHPNSTGPVIHGPGPITTGPVITINWAYVGYRASCGEEGCYYISNQYLDASDAERVAKAHCAKDHDTYNVKVVINKRRRR